MLSIVISSMTYPKVMARDKVCIDLIYNVTEHGICEDMLANEINNTRKSKIVLVTHY